jgi:iron complex transport system ATP-binding protein
VGRKVIDLEEVSFEYVRQHSVIKTLNLKIVPGELVFVVGPNGSGKSTLLQLLAGLLLPTAGEISLFGRSLSLFSHDELSRVRAWLPAPYALNISCSVREVVTLGCLPFPALSPFQRDKVVINSLKTMDLWRKRYHDYCTLSDGEKQRTHLARTHAQVSANASHRQLQDIAYQQNTSTLSRYWLLDEPTNFLDSHHKSLAMNALKAFTKNGNSVVVASHDFAIADCYADRVVRM